MDAIKMLIADHNRLRGQFVRWQEAVDADRLEDANELAIQIMTELDVHTKVEEQVFYPAVHELDEELGEVVAEGLEEHRVADNLIDEIIVLDPEDPRWKAKMTVLQECVQHHANEEESELFPPVRRLLDADGLDELGCRIDDLRLMLGAPTIDDTIHLPVKRLRDLATEQRIPGRSKMDREELAATVAPQS